MDETFFMNTSHSGIETIPAETSAVEACPLCNSTTASLLLDAPDRFHGREHNYELLRCSACTFVWLAKPPAPEDMPYHYGAAYHQLISEAGEIGASSRWQPRRDRILRYVKSGAILDIGCGSGAFLSTMKDPGWKLYGIEIEPSTAQRARSNSGADVFVGDVMAAPISPASLDVITCFDLLEHVYEPRAFLVQAMKWLKPGGLFYSVLPNIDSWESRLFGSYWYGLELPRHLSHFSPKTLRHAMTTLGFNEVYLRTRTSYLEPSIGYAYAALLRAFGLAYVPAENLQQPGFAFRALRKLGRFAFIVPFAQAAVLAGSGASVESIFMKPADKQIG